MPELEGSGEPLASAASAPLSRSRRVRQRLNTRGVLLGLGAVLMFLITVMLVLYFKPGSSAAPTGEPALDMFGAGPVLEFEPGLMTLFENERFFLVHLEEGRLIALYDLPPTSQARVEGGDLEALKCRAILREDPEMAGMLAGSGAPEGFRDRGLWDECSGSAWDATGAQVWGPENGALDVFPVQVIDGIIRVDLASRECRNPVSQEAPCIETQ